MSVPPLFFAPLTTPPRIIPRSPRVVVNLLFARSISLFWYFITSRPSLPRNAAAALLQRFVQLGKLIHNMAAFTTMPFPSSFFLPSPTPNLLLSPSSLLISLSPPRPLSLLRTPRLRTTRYFSARLHLRLAASSHQPPAPQTRPLPHLRRRRRQELEGVHHVADRAGRSLEPAATSAAGGAAPAGAGAPGGPVGVVRLACARRPA